MKQRNFYVPVESIIEFAEIIEQNELQGAITGTTEDNELEILVEYNVENSEVIIDMIEFIEELEEHEELEQDD